MKLIFSSFLFSSVVFAQTAVATAPAITAGKTGILFSCGVEMMVLNSWTPTDTAKLKPPVCFEITSKKEASISILKTSEAKQSCAEFLKNMDDSRKKTNSLKPDQQKMSEAQLKMADASEGVLGEYEVSEPKMKFVVKQKSYCFKKGSEIRVVLATYQKSKGAHYEPLITEILTTFKFSAVGPR